MSSSSSATIQRLVESHKEFLAFLRKRVESQEVAEDLLQSAFVRGLESAGKLPGEENAVAWFYRVLRNAVIDHYRARASAERALASYGREFDSVQPPPEIRQEICQCLGRLFESLKPEYRQALRVVDIEEKSLKELAALARIGEGNAAVRVHRAREALRKQVRLCCRTCSEHGCVDCTCGQGSAGCAVQKN